ncbi:DUF3263 domain-containing protein [Arthrobacter sp. fls2-241-R2A-172]|uniref:DUF3263 domain-containing protein n=1 Tax=Arthrobacter sp. fls2-241-R2A-172 TaxID=3040325 RepID=UPI003307B6F2
MAKLLTDQEKDMLDLAREHFRHAGYLDSAAMERLGLSPRRCWQEPSYLVRTEAAAAYRPAFMARINNRRRHQTARITSSPHQTR